MAELTNQVNERWAIIIDTTAYAGNFEREATAYATGVIGECEVGENMAEDFKEDFPDIDFNEIISQQPDDHGCCRPCELTQTEDGKPNAIAIHFNVEPKTEQFDLIVSRVIEYFKLYNDKVKVIQSKIILITTEIKVDCICRLGNVKEG